MILIVPVQCHMTGNSLNRILWNLENKLIDSHFLTPFPVGRVMGNECKGDE